MMNKKWILLIVLAAAAAFLFLGKDMLWSGTGTETEQALPPLSSDDNSEETSGDSPVIIVDQKAQDASEEAEPVPEEKKNTETDSGEEIIVDETVPAISFDDMEDSTRKTSPDTGSVNKKTGNKKNNGKGTIKKEAAGDERNSGDKKDGEETDSKGDGKETADKEKDSAEPNVPVKEEEGNLDKSAGTGVDPDDGWGAPQK